MSGIMLIESKKGRDPLVYLPFLYCPTSKGFAKRAMDFAGINILTTEQANEVSRYLEIPLSDKTRKLGWAGQIID